MTYLKNVTSLALTEEKCIGCGNCLNVCPHGVFDLVDGKASIHQRDNCMECGACMVNCPTGALKVNKGVGCAFAVIYSKLKGLNEITCDCGGSREGEGTDRCCSSNSGSSK